MKRIVVKIGSNVLTRDDGRLDITQLSSLVDQVAWLMKNGYEVILVSSGAMASGKGELQVARRLGSVEQRMLYSAVGQVKLIGLYYDLFREHGISVGQILTMKENFASRREYLNQRACMTVMLDNGVLPVVNENDTVSVTELMFTDNDELSGLVAAMMDAHALVILSNVDGIYNGSPQEESSQVIPIVDAKSDISQFIQTGKSSFGRGGMITKCAIAKKVSDEGIKVIVANGRRKNILIDLVTKPNETVHTEFVPASCPVSGIKKWIAHSESFAKGTVRINQKAAEKLCGDTAVSLLFVGVTAVEGDFYEGDLVNIVDEDDVRIAVGKSSFNSDDARENVGKHDLRPLIHYDYLYIENMINEQ